MHSTTRKYICTCDRLFRYPMVGYDAIRIDILIMTRCEPVIDTKHMIVA